MCSPDLHETFNKRKNGAKTPHFRNAITRFANPSSHRSGNAAYSVTHKGTATAGEEDTEGQIRISGRAAALPARARLR
ncbi:hypothetical protein NQ318_014186 [Aromia moschata]|uniref:Uncharacterized protein n=1 Tax=Aromia moschata TaxID=1265417 RepID=A0AAV8Y915_9CUCU|nr:hypothetical protein NQ318_014186 [Aromia moschata]